MKAEKLKEKLKIYEQLIRDLEASQLWIGLDIGKEKTHAYIYQTKEAFQVKTPAELRHIIGDRTALIVLENTGVYSIPYENLDRHPNITVYYIMGKRAKQEKTRRQKSDFIDALHITNLLTQIYHAYASAHKDIEKARELLATARFFRPLHPDQRKLRRLIRIYEKYNTIINAYKNRLKSHFYDRFPIDEKISDERLPFIAETLLEAYPTDPVAKEWHAIKEYIKLIKEVESEIHRLAQSHPDYPKLRRYFGKMTTAVLISIYWDISRFHSPAQFRAYFRTITRYSEESGKTRKKGKHKTKNPLIKKYFYILKMNGNKEIKKIWRYYRNRMEYLTNEFMESLINEKINETLTAMLESGIITENKKEEARKVMRESLLKEERKRIKRQAREMAQAKAFNKFMNSLLTRIYYYLNGEIDEIKQD